VVRLPRRREMPERGQFCGDCSQARAQVLGGFRAKRLPSVVSPGQTRTGKTPNRRGSALLPRTTSTRYGKCGLGVGESGDLDLPGLDITNVIGGGM
jgi:hypothetical protein